MVAEDKRISQDILVPARGAAGARKPGQVVVAEIIEQPDAARAAARPHRRGAGQLRRSRHGNRDRAAQARSAARVLRRRHKRCRASFRRRCARPTWQGREDLRDLPLVTIDGETAKDFDDAVYCRARGQGLPPVGGDRRRQPLRAATAMPLDLEARARGNSVYFPRRVIPMLPEELSNGLCSLKPEVDRLCMVCDMAIAPRGEIKDYRFYPAVMHSHARLTYTAVAAALASPRARRARAARTAAASAESAPALSGAGQGARTTRRDRLRDASRRTWCSTTRARSPHRAGGSATTPTA